MNESSDTTGPCVVADASINELTDTRKPHLFNFSRSSMFFITVTICVFLTKKSFSIRSRLGICTHRHVQILLNYFITAVTYCIRYSTNTDSTSLQNLLGSPHFYVLQNVTVKVFKSFLFTVVGEMENSCAKSDIYMYTILVVIFT